jgi:hypothetical protein
MDKMKLLRDTISVFKSERDQLEGYLAKRTEPGDGWDPDCFAKSSEKQKLDRAIKTLETIADTF